MNASTTLLSAPDEFRFPPDPEWKQLLRDDLAKQPVNFFSLATVAEAFVPHVRTMTLKGFFGDVGYAYRTVFMSRGATNRPTDANRYSKKSEIPEASRNPAAASDTFFITSHATQQKFQDVALSNQVETVFWIPAVGTQWRVRGHAVVLGGGDSEAAQREMDRHLTKGEGEWTWEREVRKIYDGLDGRARAGFEEPVRPPHALRIAGSLTLDRNLAKCRRTSGSSLSSRSMLKR